MSLVPDGTGSVPAINQDHHDYGDEAAGGGNEDQSFEYIQGIDPQLRSEFKRLTTYPIVWPTSNHTKRELAQSGLYYTGPLLFQVGCAFCFVSLTVENKSINEIQAEHNSQNRNCNRGENIPIGDATNYRYERNRLITFLSVSWTAPIDPYDLAEYGFYYLGNADVARCFACRLEVRGWEPNDQAYTEHMKWNPQCAFIQNRNVGNVPLSDDMDEDYLPPVSDLTISNRPTLPAAEHCKQPAYRQEADRVQTFTTWPLSLPQKPQELAKAGFYYTGKGDRVICFQCGGGLKDWGPGDSPWVEHAVWFQHCAYLKEQKGQDFIDNVQHTVQEQRAREQASANGSGVTATQPAEKHENTSDASSEMEEPSEAKSEMTSNLKDLRTCKVCFQKELGIVFLPCGHMATCPDCAPQLRACPICRGVASAYIRAFLP